MHLSPCISHSQSGALQTRLHLYDSNSRTASGAGDPVIQLMVTLSSSLSFHPWSSWGEGMSGHLSRLQCHITDSTPPSWLGRAQLLDITHWRPCWVQSASECLEHFKYIIRKMPSLPKVCERLLECCIMNKQFQGFQLAFSRESTHLVTHIFLTSIILVLALVPHFT